MIRSEDGQQQEIVLGNKQLLSVFFVVVALMGVAFTIGYIIGRNAGAVNVAASSGGSALPGPLRPPAASAPSEADSAPAASDPAPTAAAPEPKPEKKPAAREAAPATATVNSGSYLQVAALKRGDADHILKVLRDRGFPALLGESPKEGLYRVLVGPFHDMPTLAESKQKLRAAGFEPIVAR